MYRNFVGCKKTKIPLEFFYIFLIFALNIDCGYMLGSSNEYPQSIFWSNNKKNRYTPAYPSFVGYKGVHITWKYFHDDTMPSLGDKVIIRYSVLAHKATFRTCCLYYTINVKHLFSGSPR